MGYYWDAIICIKKWKISFYEVTFPDIPLRLSKAKLNKGESQKLVQIEDTEMEGQEQKSGDTKKL